MKIALAILIDLFDFTIGRLLFVTPFAGEIIGATIGYLMYGPRALVYLAEGLDVTEQIDGFIPTMTIIAVAAKADEDAAKEASNL